MELLSEALRTALIEQFGAEKYNAHLYLAIYAFLKNKGLENIAKLFLDQYKEENEHAEMIIEFLTDLSARVEIPQVFSIQHPEDLLEIAKLYLDREVATTLSLTEIRNQAMEDDSGSVCEGFMRKMINIQRKEYEEATSFLDKMTLIGGDWKAALLLDAAMGKP